MNEKLLTSRELADALGFSSSTVQDWVEAGRIPAFRVGGRLRFRASEVEAWLEGQRVGAVVAPAVHDAAEAAEGGAQ